MKRNIPLLITAIGGFVLIAAFFSPFTENWGESAAIWFDILAAIAFVLGGGNLLKVHLKKISDRPAGWGYSGITLLAFAVTLFVGLTKWGAPPAPKQEYYGESLAPLRLKRLPLDYSVKGTIPPKAAGESLPASAAWQIREEAGKVHFRGWMLPNQLADLKAHKNQLQWHDTVEKLNDVAQPPDSLRGKVAYYADHQVLGFKGHMDDADREALLELDDGEAWLRAVEKLYRQSQKVVQVRCDFVPAGFDAQQAAEISPDIEFDVQEKLLGIQGPMSVDQREALAGQFPAAKPLSDRRRETLWRELADRGPLTEKQREMFHVFLADAWSVEELRETLDEAGKAQPVGKTAAEMLAEKRRGVRDVQPTKPAGTDQSLNPRQVALLGEFVADEDRTVAELGRELAAAGPFDGRQEAALGGFFEKVPTEGEHRKELCLALMRAGPLDSRQRDFLLADYRDQLAWQAGVGRLFAGAHALKFSWSGEYNAPGTPFWWLYEYGFKPLTATMFAMLAFYVASAAFRAFRAKNVEASLLLGTAFIILLGRTFAGALITAWLPDWLSGLRIENLTVTIMAVFNTAGTRAIMIGIALGIASTSLKVLLGIDRSYLGTTEE